MNRKEEEEASFQSPMVKTQMFWVRCVCAKRRTKLWKREKERTVRTGIHTRQIKPGRTGAPLLGKGQLDCPFHPLLTHHCNSFLLPRVCNASQLLLTTGALIPFHEVWGYPQPITLCTCVPFIALSKSSSLNSASLLSPQAWSSGPEIQDTKTHSSYKKTQGRSFPREAHVASPWAGMGLLSACSKSAVKISWFKGKPLWPMNYRKGRASVVKRQ